MSTMAFHPSYCESGAVLTTVTGVGRWRFLVAGFALVFPVIFYALLIAIPAIRYGHFPDYVTTYDWFGNVARIVESTGSFRDMVPIILDEWLLEVGYMDMTYGHGIAEWSLSLVPHKIALMSLTGALVGLNAGLMLDRLEMSGTAARHCLRAGSTGVLTSIGAIFAGVTNATLFSIACCSTPSWVGSLAILGVESSSAFVLEPYGPLGSIIGIVMLVASALWIARDGGARSRSASLRSSQGALSC